MNAVGWVCSIGLIVLVAAGCGRPPGEREPPAASASTSPDPPAAYPDLLRHRVVPIGTEDWSVATFADRGSWLGFALPTEDRPDLRGGFTGPFQMATGRWLAAQLAGLVLHDVKSGHPIPWADAVALQSASFPGSLRQTTTLGELEITQTLWFHTGRTAMVRTQIHNTGRALRTFRVAWSGSVFPGAGEITWAADHLAVQTPAGATIRLDTDREMVPAELDGSRYLLAATQLMAVGAGEAVTVALAISWTLEGDAEPDGAPIAHALDDPDASWAQNLARWNRYLAAVDPKGTPDNQPSKGASDDQPLGEAPDDRRQIVAVKAVQTLVDNWRGPAGRMRYSSLFPSSNVSYFNGFWAWDSWKHAVGLVRFDPALAKDQVRAMFDHQDATGMVADVVYLDPDEDNWRNTKPPLAGWAIETLYQATGDLDFVRDLYPKLLAYHAFWYALRDHDRDGLCEYGATDGTLVAARWESGMDNAVRFDHAQMLQNADRAWSMNQESVDLNSYLYREKQALQALATALGHDGEASRWAAEAEALGDRIRETMFDPEHGWFYDTDIASGAIVPVQGPEGWIPLWTGVASEEQAARVRETMLNPAKFRTAVPFPTVARDDPEFSEGYWRGLVWLDQVYFAIEGLRRYGYEDDARALTAQLLANLEGAVVPGAPLRENYDALTGGGRNVKHFSWSAAHLLLLTQTAD